MTQVTCDPNDAANNKVMGILAYIGILVLVPLLAAKESKFAKYHSNQGLILLICWIGGAVALTILTTIMMMVYAQLALIVSLLAMLYYLGLFVFMILGIINAANGACKPLPVIGGLFNLIKYD